MPFPYRRSAIALLLLGLLGGALVLALRPKPLAVELHEITRGRFEAVIEEDGRTRVRERFVVSAPVAGRVLRMGVRPGDMVRQDDSLAMILAAPSALLGPRARLEAEARIGAAEAMLQQAAILVERAAAQQRQAEADAARLRDLHARGAAPVQQLERAELAERTAARDMLAAERRRHAAEHELDQARALLQSVNGSEPARERLELRAPITGRVLRVLQESEAVVGVGAPLLEIADPNDIEIIVDVLTTEAVRINPGAMASLIGWGGDAPLQGQVRLVEPGAFTRISALGVEEQRVWVVIDITSPNRRATALGDGFRVDARIVVAAVEDALLVPVTALFRRGQGWAVFTSQDGIARERAVALEQRGVRHAVVASGLSPGDRVVLFPPSSLREGRRIAPAP